MFQQSSSDRFEDRPFEALVAPRALGSLDPARRLKMVEEVRNFKGHPQNKADRLTISKTEALLVQDALKSCPSYAELFELLNEPRSGRERIEIAVQNLRAQFVATETFSHRHISICRAISELAQFEESACVDDQEFVHWAIDQAASKAKNLKLYHWVPHELVPKVLEHGLLPGFVSGLSSRVFVFASLVPDSFWWRSSRNQECSEPPLYYPRGELLSDNFVQLEIDYSDDINAYMWLGFYYRWKGNDDIRRSTFYNAVALSNQVVPLSGQISDLIDHDRETLRTFISEGRREEDERIEGRWQYSSLLGQLAPSWAVTDPGCWEHSEVMLDYVPPERIRILSS